MMESDLRRTNSGWLSAPEQRALKWLAPRVPASITPDQLTLLGFLGAVLALLGYAISPHSPTAFWLVNLALIINWLGDSLDGTLARVRKHERPRYGFYLDHITDAYSTTAIGLGLGFSPYMLLSVALAIVIAYLVLSINVYLETHVFKVFRYGYGITGPTEARLILLGLNLIALAIGPQEFRLHGVDFSVFDIAGVAAALGMIALLLTRAGRNLRELGRLEPPGTPRHD